MNIRFRLISIVTLSLLLGFSNATFAVPVKSLSLEVFKDGQQRFWEVSVNCESLTQPRVMLRPVDKDQWCSSEIATLCNKNKFSLSRQLCSDNFEQQLANFQRGESVSTVEADPIAVKPAVETAIEAVTGTVDSKAESATTVSTDRVAKLAASDSTIGQGQLASRENLVKEQMQIEEQRILIQQKRLELRRKELELQKRQLNAS